MKFALVVAAAVTATNPAAGFDASVTPIMAKTELAIAASACQLRPSYYGHVADRRASIVIIDFAHRFWHFPYGSPAPAAAQKAVNNFTTKIGDWVAELAPPARPNINLCMEAGRYLPKLDRFVFAGRVPRAMDIGRKPPSPADIRRAEKSLR